MNQAGEEVGYGQLLHRPSCNADPPPETGNQIYYEIGEARRGRGNGKALLRLLLEEAGRMGLARVRLTVTDDNPTSGHIIEGAGGVLVGVFTSRIGEQHYRLIEIDLSP